MRESHNFGGLYKCNVKYGHQSTQTPGGGGTILMMDIEWVPRDLKPLVNIARLTESRLPTTTASPSSALSALRCLSTDATEISTGILAMLPYLTTLSMWKYTNDDLAPLGEFMGLETLKLPAFRAGSLHPLKALVNLERLNLRSFHGDIAPLHVLTRLSVLTLNKKHIHHHTWHAYLSDVREQVTGRIKNSPWYYCC
jgi:hypothetical protein